MAEALGTKSHPASFLKVSTLQDFDNLISSLQSTLCDLDLINLARTSSLMHGDSMMKYLLRRCQDAWLLLLRYLSPCYVPLGAVMITAEGHITQTSFCCHKSTGFYSLFELQTFHLEHFTSITPFAFFSTKGPASK